jgi:hypothetical protein
MSANGQIVDQEFQSPFAYLRNLAERFTTLEAEECGSEQVRLGAFVLSRAPKSTHHLNRTR